MIIEITPGVKTKVPTASDFTAKIDTPFSVGQLSGVTPYMDYRKFNGVSGSLAGVVNGTQFHFEITPELFTAGEWTINFRAVVSSKTRRWACPAILAFGDPLTEVCDCD